MLAHNKKYPYLCHVIFCRFGSWSFPTNWLDGRMSAKTAAAWLPSIANNNYKNTNLREQINKIENNERLISRIINLLFN